MENQHVINNASNAAALFEHQGSQSIRYTRGLTERFKTFRDHAGHVIVIVSGGCGYQVNFIALFPVKKMLLALVMSSLYFN